MNWLVLLWFCLPAECLLRIIDLPEVECSCWDDSRGELEVLIWLLSSHIRKMLVLQTSGYILLVLLLLVPLYVLDVLHTRCESMFWKSCLLCWDVILLMSKDFLWFIWIKKMLFFSWKNHVEFSKLKYKLDGKFIL